MISVRLPKNLLRDLKFIATAHGLGYQPLMRDALMRLAESERKLILNQALERHRLEQELATAESAKEEKPAKRARKVA